MFIHYGDQLHEKVCLNVSINRLILTLNYFKKAKIQFLWKINKQISLFFNFYSTRIRRAVFLWVCQHGMELRASGRTECLRRGNNEISVDQKRKWLIWKRPVERSPVPQTLNKHLFDVFCTYNICTFALVIIKIF